MSPDIIVQHVQVWWTKRSRGGAAAAQRNRVPTAYPLTDGQRLAAVHLVKHDESDGFVPHAEMHDFMGESDFPNAELFATLLTCCGT